MNWTQIEAKWDQVKGNAKSTWSKLTDDDLSFVAGQRDKLVGKVQERYGVLEEHAQRDVDRWVDSIVNHIDGIGRSHRS